MFPSHVLALHGSQGATSSGLEQEAAPGAFPMGQNRAEVSFAASWT